MEGFDIKSESKMVKLLHRIVVITGIVTIVVLITELLYSLISNKNSASK